MVYELMSKFSGRKLELSTNFIKKAREIGSRNWDKKWEQLRLKILERDDYTCQYCGYRYEKYLNCHHIDGDSENNDLENIVVVCIDCHFILHSYYAINANRLEIFYSSKYSQVEIIKKTRSLRVDDHSDEEIIKLLDLKPVNVDEFRKAQIEIPQNPSDVIKFWEAKIEHIEERIQNDKERIEWIRGRIKRYKKKVGDNPEKVVGFVRHWKYDTRYKNYVKGENKNLENITKWT